MLRHGRQAAQGYPASPVPPPSAVVRRGEASAPRGLSTEQARCGCFSLPAKKRKCTLAHTPGRIALLRRIPAKNVNSYNSLTLGQPNLASLTQNSRHHRQIVLFYNRTLTKLYFRYKDSRHGR